MNCLPANGVEDQHNTAIHHVPLVPSKIVEDIRDESEFRNTHTSKHRLLPEAATAQISGKRVDNAEREDALDWAGNDAECKRMGMILVPGLNVECHERWNHVSSMHPTSEGFTYKQKV